MRLIELFLPSFSLLALVVAQAFPVPSPNPPALMFAFQAEVVQLAQIEPLQDDLVADLNNAAALDIGMVSNFTEIGELLSVIDSLDLGPTKFAPTWNALGGQYELFLTTFQGFTSLMAKFAKLFGTSVLPLVVQPGISNSVKAATLQSLLVNESAVLSPAALGLGREFSELVGNLSDFSIAFGTFSETVDPMRDTQQILDLLQQISTLEEELDSIRESVSFDS
ncbi:hypothetical protein BC834DRAFT_607639 [Gloeopeniophorella convolvens]|nr:hypothetical protein BC834DRAFT_607639 [Gloeopeniophorella convolvens]